MATPRRGLTRDLVPLVQESVGLDDLHVAYQPIVSVHTGRVFAYEALLRSSDRNFVGPPAVIEGSIEHNLCGELGRVMRELAIEGCREHPLFLNIHPREFDDGWVVRPDDPVFRHDFAVYLEITESVPITHGGQCHGILREIRDKGVRLAVDALGAGYSNLLYIADLSPEIVKLDRELVRSVVKSERSQRLLRAVIALCHEMGAKVVAEGIETEEELAGVKQAGADLVQGYLLGSPQSQPGPPILRP
jgi:EAL domain-containing protein (putative c-di-GMP-specific phosphodiesterase class I)